MLTIRVFALSAVLVTFATSAISTAVAQSQAPRAEQPAGPFEFETVDEAWQAAQESRDPLLLFVSSDHCYYCKKMLAETMTHPELAPAFARLFETTAVDGGRDRELVDQLGVRAYPTTVVISPEGKLLAKLEGYVEPRKIGKQLNPVLRAYRAANEAAADRVAHSQAK